jgi:hypothetical protein
MIPALAEIKNTAEACRDHNIALGKQGHYNSVYNDQLEVLLRLIKALELALYYVEGDATYEALCRQVNEILEGKE